MQATVQSTSKRPPWREIFQKRSTQWQARQELNAISAGALAGELQPVRLRGALRPGEVGLICVLRNEAARLPLFFEHYKKLGIDRFFMVDNDSSDQSAEVLRAEPLADIFFTNASYEASYFGIYWYNGIAQAYCRGHWILMADADELLVYDGMQDHDIKAFAAWLEGRRTDRAYVAMIDLYTSGVIGSRIRSVAQIVAEDSWFDSTGYRHERLPAGWRLWGGPRERLFNTEERRHQHWISKYPFFFMGENTVIFDSHLLWPWDRAYRGPDAALLHLKILDDFIEHCAISEHENQHAVGSHAYQIINQRIGELSELVAMDGSSQRYEGPGSLIRHGLLLPLDWEGRRRPQTGPAENPEDDKPTAWLKSLPRSGLVWSALDDYNDFSHRSLAEHLENVRSRGLCSRARSAPSVSSATRRHGYHCFSITINNWA